MAADTVATKVLVHGSGVYEAVFTGIAQDGAGETAIVKIDRSGLTGSPSKIKIQEIEYSVQGSGFKVAIYSVHSSGNVQIGVFAGDGCMKYDPPWYPGSAAVAATDGDVVFTTTGGVSGASYTIRIKARLH